jgi:hypothetical protein
MTISRAQSRFDWSGFERELTAALVERVRSAIAERPEAGYDAAALGHIYRETDGVIMLPYLGLRDAKAATDKTMRWSPANWDVFDDEWLPDEQGHRWQRVLTAYACGGSRGRWEATFERYLTVVVRVCKQARTTLYTTGVTHRAFVVVLLDDERYETILRRILPERELYRHFPELNRHAIEVARVAALPTADRAAYYAARLGSFDGSVDSEEAERELRRLGAAAIPALLPRLRLSGQAWQAAALLADIGRSDAEVILALDAALTQLDGADRDWTARALSRLGRPDLVLVRIDQLGPDTVVSAVAAPYTSFRDRAAAPPPLDYRPLEEFLQRYPSHAEAVAEELKPGRGFCTVTAGEVDTALVALDSPYPVVRWHAASVLGERGLGRAVARRILPALAHVAEHDSQLSVRRLALLSLLWWKRDASAYVDLVERLAPEMDAAVRGEATEWLAANAAHQTRASPPGAG